MKIQTDFSPLRGDRRPIFLAAGVFDGLHRGHRKVLRHTLAQADAHGGRAWVFTFPNHPMSALRGGQAPRLLTSGHHKALLLERLGMDGCFMIPFTPELAALEAEAFVRRLRDAVPSLAEIVIGRRWRFGRDGTGDPRLLSRLGRRTGFALGVIRPVLRHGRPISSTRIRAAVEQGDLDEAAAMLGRPFSVLGTVVPGRSVGRRLGYPTANLDVQNEQLPPRGVYTVRANVAGPEDRPAGREDAARPGIVSFGLRPTFGRQETDRPALELHLLDWQGDLYGRDIEVSLLARLRDERRFDSPEALRRQIGDDVARAREVLAAAP